MTTHNITTQSVSLEKPLINYLLPFGSSLIASILRLILGVVFIALLAQFRIEIGPVPITGQTLGVLLVGAAYGLSLGTFTVVAYLIVGGLGLGVFAGGASGWSVLQGATGGYLAGFVVAAALVGFLADRGWNRNVVLTVIAMLLGNMVIYVFGLAWLNKIMPSFQATLQAGLTPFIAGDLIKIAVAALLLPLVWRFVAPKK